MYNIRKITFTQGLIAAEARILCIPVVEERADLIAATLLVADVDGADVDTVVEAAAGFSAELTVEGADAGVVLDDIVSDVTAVATAVTAALETATAGAGGFTGVTVVALD